MLGLFLSGVLAVIRTLKFDLLTAPEVFDTFAMAYIITSSLVLFLLPKGRTLAHALSWACLGAGALMITVSGAAPSRVLVGELLTPLALLLTTAAWVQAYWCARSPAGRGESSE